MALLPQRRTRELQRGRVSLPHARYFCTLKFKPRPAIELDGSFPGELLKSTHSIIRDMATNGDWQVLCGTMMPDHIHLLVMLGQTLSISQCVAKFKVQAKNHLPKEVSRKFAWQNNFHEHRLRAEETSESYALYIFLNPYCAKLIPLTTSWPGWWRSAEFQWEFEGLLEKDKFPPAPWIKQSRIDPL